MSTDKLSMREPCLKFSLIYLMVSFALMVLFSGCEDNPDILGRELLPGSDDFFVGFDSTETIYAYTVRGDSIETSYKSIQILGSLIDPMFGFSKSEIVTQFENPTLSHSFGDTQQADSVILYLFISDFYGQSDGQQDVFVYEYQNPIYDTSYYSNLDISGSYEETPIGSGKINPADTIARIFITDNSFISKILTAEDTVFSNNDMLQNLVKGLFVTTEDVTKDGALLYIDMSNENSRLTFYYDDSLTYSFRFDLYSVHFNLYKHDYTGYPVEYYLNDNGNRDTIVFLQAMAGLYTILHFPDLEKWKKDSMPIAINQAELILTPADTLLSQLNNKKYPDGLHLYSINDEGRYIYLYDYLLNPDYFGGEFDEKSNSYRFNIKVHMQSYMDGIIDNNKLILIPWNNGYTGKRVILNGGNSASATTMKLKITYTKL